ncbi:unnamed protein product [Phaedon cochleariae]|uniref:Uncharacterized protein n=1 Tax=Phaedon cochleariae TaxID=80249 RepID=A0A9N9SF83_PHACE|nr:unnamed protein product [Phaedon cochleariae]
MFSYVKKLSSTMGNQHVKPDEKLNIINVEVSSLRYGIRNFRRGIPRETQQIQVQNLARYASEVNSLKGKVKNKNFTRTMENISRTMNEILSIPLRDSMLDSGAIETDSFVDVSINKRHSKSLTLMPTRNPKVSQGTTIKHVPTIKEVDVKFKSVKPQINLAIENKDSTQLRVLQQIIKVLATDLELIEAPDNTPVGDRKEKLVSMLTTSYQKISAALKDIRKSRDLDLAKQQRKNEAATQQLEEIRKELEATDTYLTIAVKYEKPDSVKKCQEELRRLNEKLLAVETSEDGIKANKMLMVDKISWLSKYANDCQKKGSQSDLTKAQSNYEELIKEIASGKNKDEHEMLIKLDSLGDFVNKISDDDKPKAKQKLQLLNNIQETKLSMTNVNKESSPAKKEIKDELRVTLSDKIDILDEQWDSIEKEMKSGLVLSERDRKKLITVLGKVKDSMSNVRNELLDLNKIKLGGKLNRSAPNLVKSSPVHNKFSSSLSVNYLPELPMKTKAKIYNLESPKVCFVTKVDQTSNMVNPTFDDHDSFSIIEGIKIQVNYINEKFDQIDDENHIKNKLESFEQTLDKYLTDENETIVNSAKFVLAEIKSLMRKICKLKRLKEIYLFGKIEDIQDDIERLRRIVNDYPEATSGNSFETIVKQLKCCEAFLSANKFIAIEHREEMLSRFQSISRILEKKTDIKLNLDSLKEKVKRFSGAFRGVLYNKLEKDLNRILVDTSEYIENKRVADGITRETEKQLKILESRASLAQSFRGSLTEIPIMETGDKLNNLKMELEKIRNELQANSNNDINFYRRLRSRLDLVTLDMYQLKNLNENEDQVKILMYNDIDSLKSTVDAKIALGENSLNSTIVPVVNNETIKKAEVFDEVEEKLEQLKKEIELFVGTTSDNKFYELDEYSSILISRMEDMEVPKGTKLHSRKLHILKELYEYGNLLDKRAMETENLLQYERDIADIESHFSYYSKSPKDLEKLADKIVYLKSSLATNTFNDQLLTRKRSCIEQVDQISRKISTNNQTGNYEEMIQKLEQEFRSLSEYILKTPQSSTAENYQIEKLMNLKAEVEKLDPSDDSSKTNLLEEIEDLQQKMREKEVVEGLFEQLNEFDSRITGSVSGKESNSLETEIKKFHSDIDKIKLSQEAKNSVIEKYNDILKRIKKITVPKDTYIGSTAFLKDLELKGSMTVHNDEDPMMKNLNASEKRINKIAADISQFNDSETSEEYHRLEDAILRENVFLKKLDISKDDTKLNERKIQLKEKILKCLEVLDDKIQTLEDLHSIEYQLEEFQKPMGEEITSKLQNELDEKLISLQVKLGQISVDSKLSERKLILENKIVEYSKQLKDMSLQLSPTIS